MRSAVLPGGNGHTIVIGFAGNTGSCENADADSTARAASSEIRVRIVPPLWLCDRRGLPQAREHRDADQVLTREPRVVRGPGQGLAQCLLLTLFYRYGVASVGV